MRELVIFLEEPSAEEMLKGLLPKVTGNDFRWTMHIFEGKQDLDKQLVKKLRKYNNPDAKFLVLRDQDSGNCEKIKQNLKDKCSEAGKSDVLVRIACHELESFYLADLKAVEIGLKKTNLSKLQNTAKYRQPDKLANSAQILSELVPGYQKVRDSRAIGKYLDPDNIRSTSFKNLVLGIKKLLKT